MNVMTILTHCVALLKPGQSKQVVFARDYDLSFVPHNGLRISKSDASFVVEQLCYHVDTGTVSRTPRRGRPDASPRSLVGQRCRRGGLPKYFEGRRRGCG